MKVMASRRPAAHTRVLAVLAVAWLDVSCGGKSPAPPPPSVPAPTEPGAVAVTGRERMGWGYPADLDGVGFRAYVDGAVVDLPNASCQRDADGHACSAPLPSLTPGVHVIEVSAVAAGNIEGARSSPITVQMVTRTAAAGVAASMLGAAAMPAIAVDVVLTDVPWPVQLAPLPDGRVLVGQGDGRVRVFPGTAPHRVAEALESTRKQLSEFEAKILGYYLEGLSCHEIAKAVGKSPKSVDNAVQRVRRKAAQHIFSGDISKR